MKRILFILVLAIFLVACSNDEQSANTYETIGLDEVLTYEQQGYTIVDIREKDEFEAGHIPTAINVPLSQIQTGDFGELTKEAKYIIICRSGNRSQTASEHLVEQNFNIVNVNDGMANWNGDITK